MRQLLSALALAAALALGFGAIVPSDAPMAAATGAPVEGGLAILVDSSGSMAEPTSDGSSRMAAAQQAFGTVIGNLPEDNRVGLRVFGASVTGLDAAAACTDSQLLVPIGTGNRDAMAAAVAGLTPFGETPIGYALQQAGADLGDSGQRAILLVSDGIANCEPDPCVVAQELAQGDMSLRIDVVGFDVDEAARQQLQCVADRGRGDYVDVSEVSGLQLALERLSTRAFRPFSVLGEAVDGTPAADGAPALTPGVQYVDEAGGEIGEGPLHYTIERTIPGSVVHVGIAGRLPQRDSIGMGATLSAGDATCDVTTVNATGSDRFSVFTGRVSAAEPDPANACSTAETLTLTLDVRTVPDALSSFEIRVAEHAWPANAAELPEPQDAARGWSMTTAADGASGALLGGSSLNDAPVIEPGSYTTDMLSSEFQFFRVAADWGQTVSVRAALDPSIAPPPNAWGIVQVLDPVGADVSSILTEDADGLVWSGQLSEAGSALAVTTPPVRFDDSIGLVKRPVVDGEYIVAVGFTADSGEQPTPIVVTVEVTGEASGAPDLSGTAPPPSQAAQPRAQPDTAEAIASVPWGVVLTFALVGVVVIVLIALAVWLYQRRGRRSFDR